MRAGNAVDRLVNRAVAARRQNQIAAVIHRPARQFPGPIGTRRGKQRHLATIGLEGPHRLVQTVAPPPQTARVRIEHDSDTMKLMGFTVPEFRSRKDTIGGAWQNRTADLAWHRKPVLLESSQIFRL